MAQCEEPEKNGPAVREVRNGAGFGEMAGKKRRRVILEIIGTGLSKSDEYRVIFGTVPPPNKQQDQQGGELVVGCIAWRSVEGSDLGDDRAQS